MSYGSASAVNRYVTPSGPSTRPVQPSTIREWHEIPRAEEDGDSGDRRNDIRARRLGEHGPEISQTRGAIQMQPC